MTNNDDTAPPLRPSEFAAAMGIGDRRARMLAGELEALGFALEIGLNGARYVPAALAAAVHTARAQGRDLRELRLDPTLATYVRSDKPQALDPFDALVELSAEIAILREIFGVLHDALRGGVSRSSFVAPTSWRAIGVPDPRARL